jgi:hypothetical protein
MVGSETVEEDADAEGNHGEHVEQRGNAGQQLGGGLIATEEVDGVKRPLAPSRSRRYIRWRNGGGFDCGALDEGEDIALLSKQSALRLIDAVMLAGAKRADMKRTARRNRNDGSIALNWNSRCSYRSIVHIGMS